MTVYEVVLDGQLDENPCLTVLHYDITGSGDLQAFTDAFRAELVTALQGLVVSSLVWSGLTIRVDTPGSVGQTYAFTGGDVVGSDATSDYWGLIAVIIRKLTSSGSRPAQGRIMQGGIPANRVDSSGAVAPTYRGALATAWEGFIELTFDTTGTAAMVIKASNPSAPNTVAYNPVTSMAVRPYPGKQSRRNYQN